MTSKKDLEAQIKHLKGEMDFLEDRLKWLADYCFEKMGKNLDERIEGYICNRIRYQVVDNLDSYKKGEKIRPHLKSVESILREKE